MNSKNTASHQAECTLAGWLENAVCLHSDDIRLGTRHNRILQGKDYAFLQCSAEEISLQPRAEKRPDLLFDDFEQAEYDGWTATGSAFGTGPVEQDRMPDYQGKVGAQGARLVNSHASAAGQNVTEKDAATGILTSRPFRIERDFITALVGGGAHKNRTCLRLLVKNQAVLSVTGQNDNRLSPQTLDVRRWEGQEGRKRGQSITRVAFHECSSLGWSRARSPPLRHLFPHPGAWTNAGALRGPEVQSRRNLLERKGGLGPAASILDMINGAGIFDSDVAWHAHGPVFPEQGSSQKMTHVMA